MQMSTETIIPYSGFRTLALAPLSMSSRTPMPTQTWCGPRITISLRHPLSRQHTTRSVANLPLLSPTLPPAVVRLSSDRPPLSG